MKQNQKSLILPEIGKTYAVYDDGKIRFSRLNFAKVIAIILFKEQSKHLKEMVEISSEQCPWLFNATTPYLIECEIPHTQYIDNNYEEIIESRYFALTKKGFWFDIFNGFMNDGKLDVDGELSRWLLSELSNFTPETAIEYKEDIKKLKEIYNIIL